MSRADQEAKRVQVIATQENATQEDATTAAAPQDGPEDGFGAPAAEAVVTAPTLDRSRYGDDLWELVNDPDLREAAIQADHFGFRADYLADGDYEWVAERAEHVHDLRLSAYLKLDDKAASILTWVSGATGLLVGSVTFAVSDEKVGPVVAACFLPAVLAALWSVWMAIRARMSQPLYPPPTVYDSLVWTNQYGSTAPTRILGEWHIAATSLNNAINRRSAKINRSLRAGFVAVACLMLPFVVAVGVASLPKEKPCTPATCR